MKWTSAISSLLNMSAFLQRAEAQAATAHAQASEPGGRAVAHLSRSVGWKDCQLGLSGLLLSGKGGAGKGGSGAGARQGGQQRPTFLLTATSAALLLAMSVAVAGEALEGGYSSAAIFTPAGAASTLVGAALRAFGPRRGLGSGSASTSREVRH